MILFERVIFAAIVLHWVQNYKGMHIEHHWHELNHAEGQLRSLLCLDLRFNELLFSILDI